MMGWMYRVMFVLSAGLVGWFVFAPPQAGVPLDLSGLAAGLFWGLGALALERVLARVDLPALAGGAVGVIVGVGAVGLLVHVVGLALDEAITLRFGLLLLLGYVGGVIGARLAAGVNMVSRDPVAGRPPAPVRGVLGGAGIAGSKILDTSVIIDGRIADLCETGFIEGGFILPQFILQELQHIADSSDSLKRARGRRGLDVLRRVQELPGVTVRIVDDDFPQIREVDAKVVALAKKLGAKIMTNDLNLNKVASLQGVKVLNINELSNALRPVVLPGESLRVFVLKEGKEAGQGVAYLEDGTMVVVDDAKRLISKYVDVIVTSVLQTTAGRMIFTKLREEPQE